nr:MAG TPA: hypothetical protein [Caudoviricetes sp.]
MFFSYTFFTRFLFLIPINFKQKCPSQMRTGIL